MTYAVPLKEPNTPVIMPDEPTTFLDIPAQLLRDIFEIEADVLVAGTGCPVVIPLRALHALAPTVEPADGASMVAK